MKVRSFAETDAGIRLNSSWVPGLRITVPFQDIAGITTLSARNPEYFSCSIERHAAKPLPLVFANRKTGEEFMAAVTAIISPPGLSDKAALSPEHIRSAALELLSSKGQNIWKCVEFILRQGINHCASDIMFEYCGERFQISFKIDGMIIPIFQSDCDTGKRILNSLKTAAGLLIYRCDTIQEGRLTVASGSETQNLRVSVIPVAGRERAVLRLFDQLKNNATLDDLGIAPASLRSFRQVISSPGGLIIVCGPSGAGKTTTIYAALRELKQRQGRLGGIITIEDPIEYRLDEIAQMQVDPLGSVTFASAIRSILRQDPSVIMIGEIRDSETADAAVTAALTGHLILATLHASSISEAIARLLDLGVRPPMLNSVLQGVLAQRLIRRLCPFCSASVDCGDGLRPATGRGDGCERCHGSGYHGRICIVEFFTPTNALKNLIATGRAASGEIEACAVAGGMRPLRQAALDTVRTGASDLSEVTRVTGC